MGGGNYERASYAIIRQGGICFRSVDVDVADLVGLEPLAVLLCLLRRKPGDAMALQAPVQGAAAEIGDGVLQATKHAASCGRCREERLP